MRVASLILVGLIAGVAVVNATVTADSVLTCAPLEVPPGANVTCTIRARNARGEPTAVRRLEDFSARLTANDPEMQPTLSSLAATADPTALAFTVRSVLGGRVRIDAVLAATGHLLRGSGQVALVFATPALRLGPLSCTVPTTDADAVSIALRSTVRCTAPVFGRSNVPALVTPADVFLSEDHGDGSFTFRSGAKAVTFDYTATAFPSTSYGSAALRVTLTGDTTQQCNRSLDVVYPALAASSRSTLHCSASGSECTVSAFDKLGPVAFNPALFTVAVERQVVLPSTKEAKWLDGSGMIDFMWIGAASSTTNVGSFAFRTLRPDVVFDARVKLTVKGEEVLGSPYAFTQGVLPSPHTVVLRKCTMTYLLANQMTTCYCIVNEPATPDPTKVVMSVAGGAANGVISNARYVNGSTAAVDDAALKGKQLIAFDYTAPATVAAKLVVPVAVKAEGHNVARSPMRLLVYPADFLESATVRKNDQPLVLAIGSIFFGGVLALGIILFIRRTYRGHKANERRRERRRRTKVRRSVLQPVVLSGDVRDEISAHGPDDLTRVDGDDDDEELQAAAPAPPAPPAVEKNE